MNNPLKLAAVMAWLASPVLADPVYGTWKTIPDDNGGYGHIEIQPCGDKICGTLLKGFEANGTAAPGIHNGKKIIWDMTAKGDGKYAGGKIWSPDRDKTYKSKLELVNGNNGLKVSGCIAFICRDGGTWTRVK